MLLLISSLLLMSCGADKYMKKGEKFLALGEYYDAANQFKQAYTRTPAKERDTRGKRALKMAQCYQRINATPKAIAAYRNAIRYNQASKEDQLAYARQLLKNGDYRQAEKVFLMLKDSMPGNQLVANGLKSAQMAPEWKKQGSRYIVKRMDVFNSRRHDYSPVLFGDDYDQLYFTSTRNEALGDELSGITGTKAGDIFLSEKDDRGKWSKSEAIGTGLNTDYDEGACCFTPDGREMYLTQCVTDPSSPRYAQIATSPRFGCGLGKSHDAGSDERHTEQLCPSCHLARWRMALLRFRHAWRNGRTRHLACQTYGCRTGRSREPWRTCQHSWRRDVSYLPSQWRPVLQQQRTSRIGRTRHLHSQSRCQDTPIQDRTSWLSTQLRGRRLRNDLRGASQPRLLLVQP